jgi:hypothetical protein
LVVPPADELEKAVGTFYVSGVNFGCCTHALSRSCNSLMLCMWPPPDDGIRDFCSKTPQPPHTRPILSCPHTRPTLRRLRREAHSFPDAGSARCLLF